MDLIELPLEAVAFRLYSLPESAAPGAAAWTCIAAVVAAAAAAGLWRLRAATPAAMVAASLNSKHLESKPSMAAAASVEQARSSERPRETATASSPPTPSPKERYTAYYYDSCCVGCCYLDGEDGEEAVEEDDDGDGGVYESLEIKPLEWEVVRSLPLGWTAAAEMGRYRDSAPLAGSVVRLWDQGAGGGLKAAASPRRRGRAGVFSSF